MNTFAEIKRTPEFWERLKLAGHQAIMKLMEYNGERGAMRAAHFLNAERICETIATATGTLEPQKAAAFGCLHDFGRIVPDTLKNRSHEVFGYRMFKNMGLHEIADVCIIHNFDAECVRNSPLNNKNDQSILEEFFANHREMNDYETLIQIVDKGPSNPGQVRTVAQSKQRDIEVFGEAKVNVIYDRVRERQKAFEQKHNIKINQIIDTSPILSKSEWAQFASIIGKADVKSENQSQSLPSLPLSGLMHVLSTALDPKMPIDKLRAVTPSFEELIEQAWQLACKELSPKLAKSSLVREIKSNTTANKTEQLQ